MRLTDAVGEGGAEEREALAEVEGEAEREALDVGDGDVERDADADGLRVGLVEAAFDGAAGAALAAGADGCGLLSAASLAPESPNAPIARAPDPRATTAAAPSSRGSRRRREPPPPSCDGGEDCGSTGVGIGAGGTALSGTVSSGHAG
ncbi:hypothetical protein [Streptomyces sp. NBC_01565]|uniref:hypothetical protein n=1 Tax=unclassified Streptomyces TaxID=2593676 RepID=UPI00224D5F49|nr:hypothetical protein [Streptomyces sp. NBC_01565]MCX4543852.1 hypothetical protein [Streptomyces sp. NBC_01565]